MKSCSISPKEVKLGKLLCASKGTFMDSDEFLSLLHIIEKKGIAGKSEVNSIYEELLASNRKAINPTELVEKRILSDWQLEKILKGETEAIRFQDYNLFGPISLGDFARTYKAKRIPDGKNVIIKVLRKQFQKSDLETGLFLRESSFVQHIASQNIVRPFHTHPGTTGIPPFIVYDCEPGGSIHEQLILRKSIPALEAIHLMENISNVLAELQREGIFHGNISASKIIPDSSRQIKILNFRHGASHSKSDYPQAPSFEYLDFLKITGTSMGDHQADIFFAGCLFYWMLTGSTLIPSQRTTRRKLFEKGTILNFDQHSEKSQHPEILPIIRNMTNPDKGRRYTDFSQVSTALKIIRRKVESNTIPPNQTGNLSTVFIVIADEDKRQLLRNYLQNRGLRVLGSTLAVRALEAFKRNPFRHLIVEMPTFEDIRPAYLELVREAESMRSFLNIIFLQNNTNPELIPARHGNQTIQPPHELSSIFGAIKAHEA
jgi:serine/threonine protein kinase